MSDFAEGVSRRGFLKGLMAASALVAVSPTLLSPVEAVAAPVAEALPPAELGDLWMRHGKHSWEFVGKTLVANIWTEVERDDVLLPPRFGHYRGILTRRSHASFELAADKRSMRLVEEVMAVREQSEIMLGSNAYSVRSKGYVMQHGIEIAHGGLLRQTVNMELAGHTMEMIAA
jgi:hypothetical protein